MNKYLLLAITICGWSAWSIFNKIASPRLHPMQIFAATCIVSIFLLPIYLLIIKQSEISQPINIMGVIAAMAAAICSIIGTIAYVYGIKTGDLGTISVISCSYPVLTMIISMSFFNEAFSIQKLFGSVLVVGGVIVLSNR